MTVKFHFSILYELHYEKPKRAMGSPFPHAQVKLWHGGHHWFW